MAISVVVERPLFTRRERGNGKVAVNSNDEAREQLASAALGLYADRALR